MSTTYLALMIGAVLVAGIVLARHLRRRDSGGYRRRFDHPTTHDGGAFPVASMLYIGDGGSASHSHPQHSGDCSPGADAGSGCSDGGGGS